MASGLVSICIPTYNGAKYLAPCLDSACAQTWGDLEILVVDDGSSDDTVAIAQTYAERDPRVRVVRNERNLGLVGNWNRCIDLARGEWIKYLFQDDWLQPECVAQMLAAAERPLVYCRREFAFENTEPRLIQIYMRHTGDYSVEGAFGSGTTDVSPERAQEAALQYEHANIFGEPTSCMLHRSVFERFGRFDPRLIQLCDVEFAFRVAVNTGLSYVTETLAHFRVHGGSTTAANERSGNFRKGIIDQLLIMYMQGTEPAYQVLRDAAGQRGKNLRQRFAHSCMAEQMWGHYWHDARWSQITQQYPYLQMPPQLRLKRAAKRLLRSLVRRAPREAGDPT